MSRAEKLIDSDELEDDEFEEEGEGEEIGEEYLIEEEYKEDLIHKNTKSFRCLAQVQISRSSLLLDPFYWFPELSNPELDIVLWIDGNYFLFPKPLTSTLKIENKYQRRISSLYK